MLKKISLVLSSLYTIALSVVSLVKVSDVVSLPSFNDKIAHAFVHVILVLLWFVVFYYKFNFKYNKALALSAALSFVYGILIELLQGWATISRQSDYKDVLANTLGMLIAILLILSLKNRLLKNKNSLLF